LSFLDIYQEGGSEYRGKVLGIYVGGDPEDLDSYEYSETSVGWAGTRDYSVLLDQDNFTVEESGNEVFSCALAGTWPATTLEDGWYTGDIFGVGSTWNVDIRQWVLTPRVLQIGWGNDALIPDGFIMPEGLNDPDQTVSYDDDGFELIDTMVGPTGDLFYYYRELPAGYSWVHGVVFEATMRLKWYDDTDGDRLLDDTVSSMGVDIDTGSLLVPLRFGSSSVVGTFVAVMPGLTGTDVDDILTYSEARRNRVAVVDWTKEHTYRLEYKPGVGVFLFVDGELEVRIDWVNIRNYLVSSQIDEGKLPPSPGGLMEVRAGSLEDARGGAMTATGLLIGCSNGFDIDLTCNLDEDSIDGAEGVFIMDAEDTA